MAELTPAARTHGSADGETRAPYMGRRGAPLVRTAGSLYATGSRAPTWDAGYATASLMALWRHVPRDGAQFRHDRRVRGSPAEGAAIRGWRQTEIAASSAHQRREGRAGRRSRAGCPATGAGLGESTAPVTAGRQQ